jgi:hypothetical protein
MNNVSKIAITAVSLSLLLSGCETTNSIPYKASTSNVIAIQQNLQSQGKTVKVGSISLAPGVDESLMCRMNGPVKVAPGKSLAQYIKEAFQEELFLAQVYKTDAPATINGRLDAVSFSSVSPASWNITMQVSSNYSPGYTVSVKYPFATSWTAYSACKNVADAFGPAVQELLQEVVRNPQFSSLAG